MHRVCGTTAMGFHAVHDYIVILICCQDYMWLQTPGKGELLTNSLYHIRIWICLRIAIFNNQLL